MAADDLKKRFDRIDICINNAGVAALGGDHTTKQGHEICMGVNHVGHFLFNARILPLLLASKAFTKTPAVSHPGDNLGTNRWFLQSTSIQMLPPGGSICGRLTQDLPLGCFQGGEVNYMYVSQSTHSPCRVKGKPFLFRGNQPF